MKISKILHVLSVISGAIGVLTLLGTWGGGMNGMMGYSQGYMFGGTSAFLLIAIWLQIATMHHMMLEKKGEIV